MAWLALVVVLQSLLLWVLLALMGSLWARIRALERGLRHLQDQIALGGLARERGEAPAPPSRHDAAATPPPLDGPAKDLAPASDLFVDRANGMVAAAAAAWGANAALSSGAEGLSGSAAAPDITPPPEPADNDSGATGPSASPPAPAVAPAVGAARSMAPAAGAVPAPAVPPPPDRARGGDTPSAPQLPAPAGAASEAAATGSKAPGSLVRTDRPRAAPRNSDRATLWRRLERTLIENWTGILGVVVLVAGFTFLSLNLALRLGPFPRFLLTLAVATGLILPSLRWGSQPRWGPFTLWLRSGGAALILFACMASGSMPELGLRWLEDPTAALALLLAGMAVNLALAWMTRHQALASLHGLLSLVPLLQVPADATPLALACAIAVAGQIQPGRRSWDRHRLLLVLGYGAFQGAWLLRADLALSTSSTLRSGAVLAALLVFGGALARLQSVAALQRPLTRARLATLLASWGGIGLALLVVPQQAAVRSIGLLLAAAVAAALSQRARRAGAHLHPLAHTLSAQTLVVASLLALQPLLNDGLLLTAVLLLESGLFLAVALEGEDRWAQRLGWLLVVLWALALMLQGWLHIPWGGEAVNSWSLAPWIPAPWKLRPSGLLIGAAVLLALLARRLHQGLHRGGVALFWPPLLGWLAGALAWEGSALVAPSAWRGGLALLALGTLLRIGRRLRPPGLGRATAIASAAAHLVPWVWLLLEPRGSVAIVQQLLPLAVLALLLRAWAPAQRSRSLGLQLFGLDLGLAAFLLLDPIAPALPVLAWLLLSLLALAAANRMAHPQADHALILGAVALIAGAVQFHGSLVHHVQPWPLLGFTLPPRWPLELLALAVLFGWWFFPIREHLQRSPLWRSLHPALLELILFTATLLLAREVTPLLAAITWSLLALVLLAPPIRRRFAERLRWYGVCFYGLAILADLIFLDAIPTGANWYEQPDINHWLAIALQALFVLLSRRWLQTDPQAAIRLQAGAMMTASPSLGDRIAARPHRWLGYPLFVVIALQLAHGYDHALLTLLWALEAFVIFVLSAVWRDNQFRAVALLALGSCLLRLLAVDMARSDLGLRGLVFVGVGLLMLAMNAIANRFRERFR